jgi:hypothetical protein
VASGATLSDSGEVAVAGASLGDGGAVAVLPAAA